eukprot:2735334-Alexandrium_andersonii.AAC.1
MGVFHGGDKGYYKEWHSKFVNVFTQVRIGSRDRFRYMERLDEEWTMGKFEELLGECRDPGAQAWKDRGEELNQDL